MIHICGNSCHACSKQNLKWSLNYGKSDIEMFQCGHGQCKECYRNNKVPNEEYLCPICGIGELEYKNGFTKDSPISKWATFAEWYNNYDIYITSGMANNILRHTIYGRHLIRLMKESQETHNPNKSSRTLKTSNPSKPIKPKTLKSSK